MDIFILKLFLTPLLIAALTLIGRRWGPAVSGAVAGLPLTSGPVSVFLALEQGKAFAATAAVGTLAGLIAVGAFCFAYALVASRTNCTTTAIAGAAAFSVCASLLLLAPLGLVATFIVVVFFLAIVLRMMPRARVSTSVAIFLAEPKWDLALRMAIATGLVFLLTAIAPKLGPQMTGLVSPFPVFGGVLAVFAHRHFGPLDAQRVLRSVVLASFAFAVFFLVVGAILEQCDIGITYMTAAIVSLTVNVILFKQLRGNPRAR
jgi:hypothetical protein